MMCNSCFVPKPEANNNLCEDACMATSMYIALSDGAGGGGVLADRWARYLVEHTSQKPIDSFEAFSAWMDEILSESGDAKRRQIDLRKRIDSEFVDINDFIANLMAGETKK